MESPTTRTSRSSRSDAELSDLVPIRIGSSAELAVGQSVFAIGSPFGLDATLTTGVISGLGREITALSGKPIQDVIQTDAAINPGNSAAPAVRQRRSNDRGQHPDLLELRASRPASASRSRSTRSTASSRN